MVSDQKDSGRKGDAMTNLRREIGSKPPEPAWGLIAALLGPGKYVWGLLRRRRDRKEHAAWTEILTRQKRMPTLAEVSPMCYTSRHEEIDQT